MSRSPHACLAVAVLGGLLGCEQQTGEGPVCRLEYRRSDGVNVPIADNDRVPAVFGSQGSLMVVVGVHDLPATDDQQVVVTANLDVSNQAPSRVRYRRRATLGTDGASHVDGIFLVIEQFGANFDASLEREVELVVEIASSTGACSTPVRFGIEVLGEPFRPASEP